MLQVVSFVSIRRQKMATENYFFREYPQFKIITVVHGSLNSHMILLIDLYILCMMSNLINLFILQTTAIDFYENIVIILSILSTNHLEVSTVLNYQDCTRV